MKATTNMATITKSEKRVLQSIHLQGHMGKCGGLNKTQRLALLRGLIAKGFLDSDCHITRDGVNISAPFSGAQV